MTQYVLEGLDLGLSTGPVCAVWCLPVMLPAVIGRSTEARGAVNGGLFLLGRLVTYAAVAVLAGLAGEAVTVRHLRLLFDALLVVLAFGLLVFSFKRRETGCCPSGPFTKLAAFGPFAAGMLMGVHLCQPFVLAIGRCITIADLFGSCALFSGFYVGTTAILFPFIFTRKAERFVGRRFFEVLSRTIAFIAAVYFAVVGIVGLAENL